MTIAITNASRELRVYVPPAEKRSPGVTERVRSLGQSLTQVVCTPLVMFGFNINPLSASATPSPSPTLHSITRLAKEGLKQIHEQFNADAATERVVPEPAVILPELAPVKTRTALPDRVTEQLKSLSKKLSTFEVLNRMLAVCGRTEADNATIFQIIEQVTRPNAHSSLWQQFRARYQLSWFETVKVGWVYLTCHLTSIIANTVDAYLNAFLTHTYRRLTNQTQDADQARRALLESFLTEAKQFLIADIGATRAFALDIQPQGDPESYRTKTVADYYGGSLAKLCKEFSAHIVDETYHVPLFPSLQKILVVGRLFRILEWAINRFIIRQLMVRSILPAVLESAVKDGLQATELHRLPFSVAILEFLNEQIAILDQKLDEPNAAPLTDKLVNSELLSQVVKNLIQVLHLEPLGTQAELAQKLQEIAGGRPLLDDKAQLLIEEALVDACHRLFDPLNASIQSGEFFVTLLELASKPFTARVESQEDLLRRYKNLDMQLEVAADAFFDKLIKLAVMKRVDGNGSKVLRPIAMQTFTAIQVTAKATLQALQPICARMQEKIHASAHFAVEYDIQADLADILQHLEKLASENLRDLHRIAELGTSDREAIWSLVAPFYTQLETFTKGILNLQAAHAKRPIYAALVTQSQQVSHLLADTVNEPSMTKRRQLTQMALEAHNEMVRVCKIPDAPTHALGQSLKNVATTADHLEQEQRALSALYALFPFQAAADEEREPGLLEQLLEHQDGLRQPGFQSEMCIAEIGHQLEALPLAERTILKELIGNGTRMRSKWARLSAALQPIYQAHKNKIAKLELELQTELASATRETHNYQHHCTQQGQQSYEASRTQLTQVVTQRVHLEQWTASAQLNLPFYLTSGLTKLVTASGGALAGWGLFNLTQPLGALGASLASGLGTATYLATRNIAGLASKKTSAFAQTALAGVAGATVSYFLPGASLPLSSMAAGLAGLRSIQAFHDVAKESLHPAIKEIFDNARRLFTDSPRVYHALATRTMCAMTH